MVPTALAVVAAALFLPLLRLPFVADDYPNLLHPWNFVAVGSPEFRPLASALFAGERAAFGLHPLPWHLLSLALFVAAVVAAHRLALRLARGERAAALAAAAVFVLDPRAVQAVVWASAVSDLGYALAFLLALLAWPRRPWLCAGLYLISLGFKEAAVLLPAALLAADLQLRPAGVPWPDRLRRLLPCLGVAAAFAAFEAARPQVLGLLGDRATFVYAITGGYHLVRGPLLWRNLEAYPALALMPWARQAWALRPPALRLLALPAAALLARWLWAGGLRRLGALWIGITVAPMVLFAPYDVSDLYLYLPVFGLGLGVAGEMRALAGSRGLRALPAAALAALLAAEATGFLGLATAWRRDGAAFVRARAALVAEAAAHPAADLVVRGLPSLHGEVYLWLDALPFAVQLLVPGFRGGAGYRPERPGAPVIQLRFASDGRLLGAVAAPSPPPGR